MVKYLGIILLVLALVIAIFPQFTTCESQGRLITLANGSTIPMKCSWTARAELGISIPILVIGALLAFIRRRDSKINLSIVGTVLGIMAVMIPTFLIGVCQTNMVCNTVMKPILITSGSLVTVISLVSLMVSIGFKGKVNEFNQVSDTKY
jgi:hypothetical protein